MNIKLVAIAKDEAAYLPEWIYHHLYFGFDVIDIYINFTSDVSEALIQKISEKYSVNLFNAEDLLDAEDLDCDKHLSSRFLAYNKLQARAYADSVKRTLDNGSFSHIMFLDIDEFWTPNCFNKSVKDVLQELSCPEVVSFYWRNKVKEQKLFDRPYQQEVSYQQNPHYKTILTLDADMIVINTHRSLTKAQIAKYGDRFNEESLDKASDLAFILHRFQRHEDEYISMLGRGDATSPLSFNLKFTRTGYQRPENPLSIKFNTCFIDEYDSKYNEFLTENNLSYYLEKGKEYVLRRKDVVIDYIKKQKDICENIKKVIPGTSILKNYIDKS